MGVDRITKRDTTESFYFGEALPYERTTFEQIVEQWRLPRQILGLHPDAAAASTLGTVLALLGTPQLVRHRPFLFSPPPPPADLARGQVLFSKGRTSHWRCRRRSSAWC